MLRSCPSSLSPGILSRRLRKPRRKTVPRSPATSSTTGHRMPLRCQVSYLCSASREISACPHPWVSRNSLERPHDGTSQAPDSPISTDSYLSLQSSLHATTRMYGPTIIIGSLYAASTSAYKTRGPKDCEDCFEVQHHPPGFA